MRFCSHSPSGPGGGGPGGGGHTLTFPLCSPTALRGFFAYAFKASEGPGAGGVGVFEQQTVLLRCSATLKGACWSS